MPSEKQSLGQAGRRVRRGALREGGMEEVGLDWRLEELAEVKGRRKAGEKA